MDSPTEPQAEAQAATPEASHTLGSRIRAARELRGLSLRQLAAATKLSPGFISQLENNHSNASVANLKNIATVLGVGMAELMEGRLRDSQGVLRKEERPVIQMSDGLTKFILTRTPLRNLEVYTATIEPGGSTGSELYSHGHAQELVLCLKGHIELFVGSETHRLAPGDSIEYLTNLKHGLRNIGTTDAEVLWVMSPPTG